MIPRRTYRGGSREKALEAKRPDGAGDRCCVLCIVSITGHRLCVGQGQGVGGSVFFDEETPIPFSPFWYHVLAGTILPG